jgi:hypothetical protein
MHVVYEIVRVLHLVGGAVGLLLVPVPLLTKKGGKLHKQVGKWFVLAMTIASWSGLAMALSWLVAPMEFRPAGSDADAAGVRASGLFLGTIALITLSGIHQLVRAPARKRESVPAPTFTDRALPLATSIAGVATAATGLVFAKGLLVAFGSLAVFAGIGDLRFSLRKLPSRMAWWYQHMSGAMVTVIAALTAFLVFGGRRLLAQIVPDGYGWILWIAPAIVIVPATELWIRRYKRRFGEARA